MAVGCSYTAAFTSWGWLASCRALLSSQRCLTVGKKVQVRREELALSSQAYEHTDAGRCPCIIPLCRRMSEPLVHKHVRACGTYTYVGVYIHTHTHTKSRYIALRSVISHWVYQEELVSLFVHQQSTFQVWTFHVGILNISFQCTLISVSFCFINMLQALKYFSPNIVSNTKEALALA